MLGVLALKPPRFASATRRAGLPLNIFSFAAIALGHPGRQMDGKRRVDLPTSGFWSVAQLAGNTSEVQAEEGLERTK
jgi:hypothetical protein